MYRSLDGGVLLASSVDPADEAMLGGDAQGAPALSDWSVGRWWRSPGGNHDRISSTAVLVALVYVSELEADWATLEGQD